MAYKALYRTYRPQKFSEVVGQETIVKALQNALSAGKITHAYLFSGPRGIGKTTIARIFAKALNCEKGHVSEPCCECSSCKEISEGVSPNVIEIDAASNNGVDEIRDIREKSKFLPAGAKYKIYIVDEVHMLSTGAFNALLKILEEPPKHVIFILATTEPHKVLPTILSRCQRYDFHAFTKDEIKYTLKMACENEKVNITEEALDAISVNAEGGMRDAYSILDQVIALSGDTINVEDVDNITGSVGVKKTLELVNLIENKDISNALGVINELVNLGKDAGKIVNNLLEFYKDTIIYKSVSENTFSSEKAILNTEEYKAYANSVDLQKLFYYVDILNDLQNKIRFSTTPLIYLEVSLIKMINITQGDMDFSKRIGDIEESVRDLKNVKFANTSVSYNTGVDMEKINMLDEKINQVINELNRMELPKLITKVQEFEASSPNLFIKKINELMGQISKVSEEVELLKVTNGNSDIEPKIVNNEVVSDERLEALEELIKKNKPTVNYTEIESFIDRKLDYFEEKINKNKEEDKKPVKEEKNVIFISDELEDRLRVLEQNTFKLMSGALIPQENPAKKQKPVKAKEQQLALFSDELIAPSEIQVVNEKVDFSELENEEVALEDVVVNEVVSEEVQVAENNMDDTIEEEMNEEITLEEISKDEEDTLAVEEENIEEVESQDEVVANDSEDLQEEVKEEVFELKPRHLNPFEKNNDNLNRINAISQAEKEKPKRREKVDPNADLFAMYSQSLQNKDNQKEEVKDSGLSPAEKALNQSVASLGSHYVTANSELVRGERGSSEIYFGAYRSSNPIVDKKDERKEALQEDSKVENNDTVQTGYDVKVLERILNDSRTEEARNDKSRLANLWKFLPTLAPSDKRGVAEMLAEGVINAVGKNEFVITYSSSAICNQVMSKRFKRESLKLLYEMLDSEYDYLALPNDVWFEKRTEYVNQYNIGIKYPKLTPFNNPELNVAEEYEEKSESEKMLEKARSIFGDNLKTINKMED